MNHTATSISNLALDDLKAANIASLNENSVAGAACRRQYPQALAEVLEAHDWGFARRRVSLAALPTNARSQEWGFAYAMPGDMALPVQLIVDYGDTAQPLPTYAGPPIWAWSAYPSVPIPFDYAGSTIWAGIPDAILEYISDNPESSTFPALFVRALRTTLAASLAMPIKGDRVLRDKLLSEAQTYYERAVANNDARKPMRYGDGYIPDVVRAREGW